MKKVFALCLVLALAFSAASALAEAPVKLTMSVQTHSEDRYDEGVALFTSIARDMGIELELITYSDSIADEKQNTTIASGEIPDLFFTSVGNANLYGDELFVDLTTLADQIPNLAALMAKESVTGCETADGELYFAPKYASLYSTTEGNITYRKDILDALGLEEPTTMDEWHDAYTAVKEAYPDMLVLMERSASIENNMRACFSMCGLKANCGVLGSDLETVVFLPTTENWKAMLEFYHDLYAEGILYEGYATVDYAVWWDESICTDKAFACNTMNFNRAYEATTTAHDNGYENVEWRVAKMVVNDFTNTDEILLAGTAWLGYGIAISKNCANVDKAAAFLDYFYSDAYTAYQKDLFDAKGQEPPFFYAPCNFLNTYTASDIEIMKDHFSKNSPLVKLVPTVSSTPEGAQAITDSTEGLGDYVALMRDSFIMGMVSFDEWDNYVAECEKLGCEVAVEVVQGYLDTATGK